ncbi:hypothetical protein GCM10023108_26770 [Saccharopolyspora hordei]
MANGPEPPKQNAEAIATATPADLVLVVGLRTPPIEARAWRPPGKPFRYRRATPRRAVGKTTVLHGLAHAAPTLPTLS